ncbi:uncharacterized protein LOC132257520 isoform X1 [Phlebotomus argentipes]|uniref:uncharacterized protein LOC132257520 isoform X1 n=1 Tax=Phlebotomus argentipes TaxID=94469 RepID=UPI00289312BF|nr:uncharacterized protein LOC132257520 isoform X1 [Phlebotomus argentipes]
MLRKGGRTRRGNFIALLDTLARWSTIFMVLGFAKDGNGLIQPPQTTSHVVADSSGGGHLPDMDTNFLNSVNRNQLEPVVSSNVSANRINHINKTSSPPMRMGATESAARAVDNQLSESEDTASNFNETHFATENSSTVIYQAGSIAILECIVRNIGENVVSWIRRKGKDYHLLTVGLTTYSGDERFSAIHPLDSEDWTLQIKFVTTTDAGVYECQVSTHPPISIFTHLHVVEARAEIAGPQEKYLKPGSTLRLVCRVLQSTEPPLYLFWYHNNRMINYDSHRGVNVSTDADNRHSELLILQTSLSYSGNYSCVPNNAISASVLVHILNAGENPAAMQHGEHNGAIGSVKWSWMTSSVITLLVLRLLLGESM